ncbi:hypothetical protein GCM10007941_02440 [Amphritea balenae]|nr:hypothetical protein GCM10007941_02440 [Amphritea balenae]
MSVAFISKMFLLIDRLIKNNFGYSVIISQEWVKAALIDETESYFPVFSGMDRIKSGCSG